MRFVASGFFMNHLLIKFLQKFVDLFASQGSPPATTPVTNLPQVSTTLATNFAKGTLVSLIPVANNLKNIRLLELEGKIYLYVNSTTYR